MTDERLYHLFKLHEIDEKLLGIKARAENLDVGKRELAGIKKVQADYAEDLTHYEDLKKQIAAEHFKAEQASEKIKKFNAQLYNGSIVSSKEVENLQKEIQMLEDLGMQAELKAEELEKENGSLSKKVSKINAKLEELEVSIQQKRLKAEEDHVQLKTAFKEVGGQRAEREAAVEPDLLKVYDAARKKTGNTGMALVTSESRCGACGVPVPERTRDAIRLGKTQQCESCRRVLFIREESLEL